MSAGRLAAAYINTATGGSAYASPTWTNLAKISDVQRPRSRSTSDRAYRGAENKKKVSGYRDYGFSFKYHKPKSGVADTVLDKLEDSFLNGTTLDICFLDGRIAAGTTRKGERGAVVVTKCDINEADEEGVTVDIELVEVEDATIPEFSAYTVTTP